MSADLAFQLTERFLQRIRKKLSLNGFLLGDFSIEQTPHQNAQDRINLNIQYKYTGQYYLNAEVFNNGESFDIKYSPGNIVSTESISNLSPDKYTSFIDEWTMNLRDELTSSGLGREVYETQEKVKQIEELIKNKFQADEEKYYTRTEADELREKLDELEKQLQEVVQNNAKKASEQESIAQEIKVLKEQVAYLPKNQWMLSLFTRMFNWGSRNPKVVKEIGRAAKELLPEEIKNSIPSLPDVPILEDNSAIENNPTEENK